MQNTSRADTGRLVSAVRIEEWVARFAAVSAPGPGVTRLAHTALERTAHELFARHLRSLGLSVWTDAAGNTIAELAPTNGCEPKVIGTGSHLDSVPEGGRFDGTAGVVAALEVATVMVTAGIARRHPWRFVAFAAEEGARFGQACNGSRMAAGLTNTADTKTLRDSGGVAMHEAMQAVGLRPDQLDSARWDGADWLAFVELHVEQGRELEDSGLGIGVVETVSGSTRLLVTVTGEASHTGGTPMRLRKDALVTAAECVLACDAIAADAEGIRITVGRMNVEPGSITTIPGRAVFTVDIRDTDYQRQRQAATLVTARCRDIARRRGTEVVTETIADTAPVVLSAHIADSIAAAAQESGLRYRRMPSGASHDTQQIGRIAPAGMIFVPSRGGLSHVPAEFTPATQLAAGAQVLLRTLIRLDEQR